MIRSDDHVEAGIVGAPHQLEPLALRLRLHRLQAEPETRILTDGRHLDMVPRTQLFCGNPASPIAKPALEDSRPASRDADPGTDSAIIPPSTPDRETQPVHRLRSSLVEPTIYEAMGGADALLALAEAWHRRCLADPILAHPFEGEIHPQHTERLAAYWSEQLGGPATYTESLGDYSHVVRVHSGNGPHEQMDGRAVAAFVLALDDVGIPTDPRLRFQLIAWFTWATAMLNHRWAMPDEVPSDLPLPSWDWDGTEGW